MSKKGTKKSKKGLSDNARIGIFAFVIVFVISLIGVACYFLFAQKNDPEDPNEKKNVVTIDGYGITVDDDDTELYRDEYNKLKGNLESDSIDYDAYAESVARMFIIDLYTLNNKVNKYDVGGVEFVLPEGSQNYITNVTDTLYKYLEADTGDRTQKLPEVSAVTVNGVEKKTFKLNSNGVTYDSYVFDIEIEYVNDYGYDKKAEVIVINVDNKMYVVEKN